MRSPRSMGCAVLGAAVAALCVPAGAAGQAPAGDSASGSGGGIFYQEFAFGVQSGPSGEDPFGMSMVLAAGERFFLTSVDCLLVSGSTATFAGPLAPNTRGFTHGKTTVVDGGPAGAGDTYTANGFFGPSDCSPFPVGEALQTGDIVVRDAQPVPTTKEQCRDDPGYRALGFRNQGQCIAAVQRPPGP